MSPDPTSDPASAAFASYGWPASLPDTEILTRLVALNAARASEESTGLIRWLRPAYQCPTAASHQTELNVSSGGRRAVAAVFSSGGTTSVSSATSKSGKIARATAKPCVAGWPKSLPSQIRLLRDLLAASPSPVTAEELSRMFSRVKKEKIEELLQTLVTLGQAREMEGRGIRARA